MGGGIIFVAPKVYICPSFWRGLFLLTSTFFSISETDSRAIQTQERQLISKAHLGGGGQFLSERSWRGLEQKLGNTPPSLAVQGQAGIASYYAGEGETEEDKQEGT